MHGKEIFINRGECEEEKDTMGENREVYRKKREAELKELSARLDALEAQAKHAPAEAKIGYPEQIYELQEKRRNLKEQIDGIKDASGDAWKGLAKGVEEAITDLRTALDVAATRFK
jgi:hypothetical protein